MTYRVFICERGDIFIFDAESGQHLVSPYMGGDDPTQPFRRLVVQESCVITCDDLAEACEFLTKDKKYTESWRYGTWLSQLIWAAAELDQGQ